MLEVFSELVVAEITPFGCSEAFLAEIYIFKLWILPIGIALSKIALSSQNFKLYRLVHVTLMMLKSPSFIEA